MKNFIRMGFIIALILAAVSCKKEAEQKVTEIKLTPNPIVVEHLKSLTLQVEVIGENLTDTGVNYKSADIKIATVDKNGKITGLKVGKTTITITAKADPNFSLEVPVEVVAKSSTTTEEPIKTPEEIEEEQKEKQKEKDKEQHGYTISISPNTYEFQKKDYDEHIFNVVFDPETAAEGKEIEWSVTTPTLYEIQSPNSTQVKIVLKGVASLGTILQIRGEDLPDATLTATVKDSGLKATANLSVAKE